MLDRFCPLYIVAFCIVRLCIPLRRPRQHLLAHLTCRADHNLLRRTAVLHRVCLVEVRPLSRGSGLEHSPSATPCQKQNGTFRGTPMAVHAGCVNTVGCSRLAEGVILSATCPLHGSMEKSA